jgi:hypothetical protein
MKLCPHLKYFSINADKIKNCYKHTLIMCNTFCFSTTAMVERTRFNVTSYVHCLSFYQNFNPLNAELSPICHLLVLLGYLTFMDPCIVSIFQYTCIYNKMQRCIVHLYLETALHVSGGTSTHHQERIQLWRTPPTAHSNRFQLFHDSGR